MTAMHAATVLPRDFVRPPREQGAARVRPSLRQCLLLAGLMHALLVALVGTAPGIGVQLGAPSWGAIHIRLGGARGGDERGRAERAAPVPVVPGQAPAARYGGTAPQAHPLPTPEAGAAEIGARLPRTTQEPMPTAPPPRVLPESRSATARPPTLAAPGEGVLPVPTPALEREPLPLPATSERLPRPLAPTAAPSTAPHLAATPTIEAPALRRPLQASPEMATPRVEVAPVMSTSTVSPPPTAATPGSMPADPLSVPLSLPRTLTPPASPEPLQSSRSSPSEAQALPSPPLPRVPEPTLAPVDAQTLPAALLAPAASPSLGDVRIVAPGPSAAGAAGQAAPPTETGMTTMPPTPSAHPRLNLELPPTRPPAPALAAPRLLNLVAPPPERRSSLAEGIEKAARPDCRTVYGGMGALAVVPLAVDALRDGGCRW